MAISKGFLDFYFGEPVQDGLVFIEGLGKWYKGSAVYLVKELMNRERYGDLKICYSVMEETLEDTKSFFERLGITDIEYVLSGTTRYRQVLATAKYLINECDFPSDWIRKDEQVYLNIWHGTPLKKLGIARMDKLVHDEGNHQRNFIMADYILCPNEYTRDIFLDDYHAREFTRAKLLMKGYPRTGQLLQPCAAEARPRRRLAFMPTWREGAAAEQQAADLAAFFSEVSPALSPDLELYVNLHHKIAAQISLDEYEHIHFFPKEQEVYEFLQTVDVLITDYSSLMFDFAVTRKKIVLYCPDLAYYSGDRGFYFDIHELPFPITQTLDELLRECRSEKNYDDTAFLQKFCPYDGPDNTEAICRAFILGDCSMAEIQEPKRRGGQKVLVYADQVPEGKDGDLLKDYFAAHNNKDYEAYLSFKDSKIAELPGPAYPLLEEQMVLGCRKSQLYTRKMKEYRQSEMEGDSLQGRIKNIERAYKTEQKRRYADARFDLNVLWNLTDIDAVLAFSYFTGYRTIVLGEQFIAAAKADDLFRQAVQHYIDRCLFVLVTDPEAESLFRFPCRKVRAGSGKELEKHIRGSLGGSGLLLDRAVRKIKKRL